MADEPKTEVPVATGVTLNVDPDSTHTGVFFRTKAEPGFVAVTVANKELSRLVALQLNQAQKVAREQTSSSQPESMQTTPILASQLGVTPGRDQKEAILTFRVGNLDLSFAVGLSTLYRLCTDLLANTTIKQPVRRN